ncbi:MAG TPA: hypothetical protein VHG93_02045, partial [Longimicrobium sp.]|nr:hypothetical protein [Longimicrobium sp.]
MAASNRSVAYVSPPVSPRGVARSVTVRSNLAVVSAVSTRRTSSPDSAAPGPSASCSSKSTCTSGEWLRARSGRSSSTSRSNETSWCSYAPSVPARTRRSTSRKRGLPERSARSTSTFMKRPISPSVSPRVRPAMVLPTTTSST